MLSGSNSDSECIQLPDHFARAAQILRYSNTRFSPDGAGEKRSSLSANIQFLLGCTSRTGQSRNIPRKARKGRKAKKSDYLAPSKRIKILNLASLRPFDKTQDMLGERNFRIRDFDFRNI